MSEEREVLGWDEFGSASRELAQVVVDDGWMPDAVLLPPMLDEVSLSGKRVLLTDDVSDSGRTLAMVVKLLEATGAEVRTIVLYTKPGTVHEPTYTWRRTPRWITFPWSALPPVTATAEGSPA